MADIVQIAHTLKISGELNFKTVMDLFEKSKRFFDLLPEIHIDLSGVERSNSAGLALLIEWKNLSNEKNKPIFFSHIPNDLQSIASISQVDRFL